MSFLAAFPFLAVTVSVSPRRSLAGGVPTTWRLTHCIAYLQLPFRKHLQIETPRDALVGGVGARLLLLVPDRLRWGSGYADAPSLITAATTTVLA